MRLSAWVWSFLTLLKLLPLLLLAGSAAGKLTQGGPPGVWVLSGEGLWRAALIAVFPLQGFEIVAVPAGEAHGSRRTVLAATLASLGFAAALYVLLQRARGSGTAR